MRIWIDSRTVFGMTLHMVKIGMARALKVETMMVLKVEVVMMLKAETARVLRPLMAMDNSFVLTFCVFFLASLSAFVKTLQV